MAEPLHVSGTDFSEFRRAIVVGASSGIGEALARDLAAAGSRVALVARRKSELDRIAKSIRESGKGEAHVHVHDVAHFAEVPALFDKIVEELGGLDMIVYAAGVMPELAEGEYDFAKDKEMVDVNLLGAMAWLNPCAALFEAQRRGTIAGISSVAGERGRRKNPAYCTTKAALTTYLESLRNRLSRYGVNVVTVKPGFVDTAMTKGKKGLFWLITAEQAATATLDLIRKGTGAAGFVPQRWAPLMWVIRHIPSFAFRKLNF
ncbi:MAG: SDR family NAD(P)-dependent oxidoreductase [Polyangiaceae bacterium]